MWFFEQGFGVRTQGIVEHLGEIGHEIGGGQANPNRKGSSEKQGLSWLNGFHETILVFMRALLGVWLNDPEALAVQHFSYHVAQENYHEFDPVQQKEIFVIEGIP